MSPMENTSTNEALSREDLEKRAFCVIMMLDEETRNALLAPYKEKYYGKSCTIL